MFSIAVAPYFIPQTVFKCFNFSSSLQIHVLFLNRHSDSYEVQLHYIFDLNFYDHQWWVFFHITGGHLYVFYGKIYIQVLFLSLKIRFLGSCSCGSAEMNLGLVSMRMQVGLSKSRNQPLLGYWRGRLHKTTMNLAAGRKKAGQQRFEGGTGLWSVKEEAWLVSEPKASASARLIQQVAAAPQECAKQRK